MHFTPRVFVSSLALAAAAASAAHGAISSYSLSATGLNGSWGESSFTNATVTITSNIDSSAFQQPPHTVDGWTSQFTASCSVNFSISSSTVNTSFTSSSNWFCYYFVGSGYRIAGFTPTFATDSLGFGAAELGTAIVDPFTAQTMNESYTPTYNGFFQLNGSLFQFDGGGNFTMVIGNAVPAPGAIALLGVAGLARRRRR